MSTSVLKALPGKLDIKRHSPSILYLSVERRQELICQAVPSKHLEKLPIRSKGGSTDGVSESNDNVVFCCCCFVVVVVVVFGLNYCRANQE